MIVPFPMQKLSFDKRRIKFLFLEGIHANAVSILESGLSRTKNLIGARDMRPALAG